MNNVELITKMIGDYGANVHHFQNMKDYYEGKHDILQLYLKHPNRSNLVVIENFVNKFINEECQYSLGNPLSYISLSGNDDMVKDIYKNLFHWKNTHDQELMRTLEIYGKAFALHYIDAKGRFSERILSPYNAVCYCNDDGVPVRFIHFYKKKYEEEQYHDIYYPDGVIEVYRGNTMVQKRKHPFKGVPVSICKLDNIEDTIYYKIKTLQDAYNQILSDQTNTIADYRNAYLVISGVLVDEETEKKLTSKGILNLPSSSNTSVKWLTKDMPDTYIQNELTNLRNAMYSATNHIDGNEKLQSNTSGTALRNRLVFLEQRCNMMLESVLDTVYERIERLFEYLSIKGTDYDITDLKVVSAPSIPQDETAIINSLVQLGIGEHISLETALSRLPFVESPSQEIEKIRQEKATMQKQEKSINLEMVDDLDDDDGELE